jgi:uncharacterized YceG family protein
MVALVILAALIAVLYGIVRLALDHHSGTTSSAVTTPPEPFKILFPEGFTRRQIADRIDAVSAIAQKKSDVTPILSGSKYLQLTASSALPKRYGGKKSKSIEGFLFPDTYEFTATTTNAQLVSKQLEAFRKNWKKLDLKYARSKNLTSYDVLIIASMVEKEAAAPEERAKVAGVIYNRLHHGMRLEIDATLRYGLNLKPTQPLSPHLKSSNIYNTRKYAGLPPTPIANPGLAAMQAAAHPNRRHDYLYYLRKPHTDRQYFTSSYKDFVNHERAWGYIK